VNVLLAAQEAAGLHALRLVAESEHRVAGVLTSPEQGRGASVHAEARRLELPVLQPALLREAAFADWIDDHRTDLLLNVHALEIAHPAVVAAPRIGSFNLHPGPLPRYAGLNAPSWAIYEGRRDHAVTVHWMEAAVDAGAIAYEEWFAIEPGDTGLTLSARCAQRGIPLLKRLLEDAVSGRDAVPAHPQDAGERRWFGREPPHGGRLPWDASARLIVDFVRAADYGPFASPWGHPVATLGDHSFEVVRASLTGQTADQPPGTVGPPRGTSVAVAGADEWVAIERLREHGSTVDPTAVLREGQRFDA
jgi:methionyl-tRNA formyltransferase